MRLKLGGTGPRCELEDVEDVEGVEGVEGVDWMTCVAGVTTHSLTMVWVWHASKASAPAASRGSRTSSLRPSRCTPECNS